MVQLAPITGITKPTHSLLREGTHVVLAAGFGLRPSFGIKPPLVYMTFEEMIPRAAFVVIALARLVLLDVAFCVLYSASVMPLFFLLCIMVNTIGAAGDVWTAVKIAGLGRGALIRDTRTGFEVWQAC